MARITFKVAIATAGFAAVHSLLASTWAKRYAVQLIGPDSAYAFYRLFYVTVSFVLAVLLFRYLYRQPRDEAYRVHGPLGWAMRGGQVIAAIVAIWSASEVGSGFMLGLDQVRAWREGTPTVTVIPDGQGPPPGENGEMRATGPFSHVRQPLNLLILPLLLLNPSMSSRLLGFTLVATAYAIVGTLHSESHLLDAYGEAYRAYQRNVPLVPGLW